jgi:hypothetical protein
MGGRKVGKRNHKPMSNIERRCLAHRAGQGCVWVSYPSAAKVTPRRPDRRGYVFREASADAGCGKSECRHVPPGKTGHACHARDGARLGERHRKRDLKPGCRQASGNNPQARRYSGRFELCPIRGECNRRWIGGRLPRDAKNETWPRLARHGNLEGLTDTAEDVAFGDTADVAFVDSRPKRGKLGFVPLFFAL